MSDVYKFGKKLFTLSVVAVTIAWSMGLAALVPAVAQAAECPTLEAGDLYKIPGNPAVYMLSSGLKRMSFPSGREFLSWGFKWTDVTEISSACGASYPSGGMVKFRPGILVKNMVFANVYQVLPGGEIAHVTDATVAASLYGADWENKVHDVADVFLDSYTDKSAKISTAKLQNGMLVKVTGGTDTYYVSEGKKFKVDGSLSGTTSGDVRTVSQTVFDTVEKASTTVTEAEVLTGALVSSEVVDTTPTASSTLTVSLSADTPAGGNVVKLINVDVAKFVFKAGSNADVKVNSVKIGRSGLGATGDFASITLYDGTTKLGTTKSSWASDGTMTYNISGGWTIPKGTSKTLTMVANFDTTGTYNALGVAGVSLASGTTTGVPVYGNQVTAVNVSVGGVAITNQGSDATGKKIGSTDVTLSQFRLAVDGVEDAKLRAITLKNKGTAADGDVANLSLYKGTTKLAGPVSMVGDKITFDISEDAWVLIKKSKNEDFKVLGDIVDGNGNTVEFVLDATTDLKMYGETYHSQLIVTSGNFNEASDFSGQITIAGSQLNIAYTGSPVDTTDDTTDRNFGTLTLSSGNTDVKITTLILTIDETDGDSASTTNKDVDEFELIAEDGTAYTGTMTGGDGTNGVGTVDADDEVWTFSDEIYLEAGKTLKLKMQGDLPDGIGDEDSYKVTMTVNTTNLIAETVPAGDAVSSFSIGSINGKLVTVKTPYLTIKTIDMNSTLKAVINQENVVIYKGTLEAVSDTITLSRLKFEGGHATAGNVALTIANLDSDNWASLGLYKVTKDADGKDVYTLLQNVNNSDLTTGYVDFNSFSLEILPGSANKVTFAVKGTIDAVLDTDGPNTTVHAQLDTVTVKDSDGEVVSAKNSAGTAIATAAELEITTKYTLGGVGTLYVAMRNADAGFNKDRVLLAGQGSWVGKLRLRAEYEDVKVLDLKLTNNSADDEDSVVSVCLYKAQSATAENLIPNGCTDLGTNDIAFFDDLNYEVKEGTQDVYVYVTTRAMGNAGEATADKGDMIAMKIVTTTGNLTARGVSSNTDLAYGDLADAESGEIVFDLDLDGTFDEAADAGGTATGKSFYVAGSRFSNVALVSSYSGETVDTVISGGSTYTLAILAITNENHNNTDANGNTLMAAINNLVLDVTKHTSTTFSGATIDRIGGTQNPGDLTIGAVDGFQEIDGDWTMANVTTTLGVDAQIAPGTIAYFVVKGTISALDATTGVVDWVRVSLNDVTGGGTAYNDDSDNNIDWFDGYDTTYTDASNFEALYLDTTSITGTKVAESL